MTAAFITFEGLDGSGKSTHLQRRGGGARPPPGAPTFSPTSPAARRSPTASAASSSTRAGARSTAASSCCWCSPAGASTCSSASSLPSPPARSVLCDRFTDSTYAYQGHGRGLPLDLIDRVDELATGRRRPDRTLLFDLPAEEARRRGHSPARRGRGAADRLDAEDVAFYQRVRGASSPAPRRSRSASACIDSSGPRAATAAQVREALADLLELAPGGSAWQWTSGGRRVPELHSTPPRHGGASRGPRREPRRRPRAGAPRQSLPVGDPPRR